MPTLTKLYTPLEATQHKTRDDCWVIVDGKVYDVTDYLDEHPGGDDVLLKAAGRDATEDFNDAGHSKSAIELMKGYCIGELETPIIPEPEIVMGEQTASRWKTVLDFNTKADWLFLSKCAAVGVVIGAVAGVIHARMK